MGKFWFLRPTLIHSDISGIDTQIPPNEARRMQAELQNMWEESENTFLLDPLFNSPSTQDNGNQESSEDTDRARETEISELYIDEEFHAEWSKTNLTANTFPIEPFPVKAPSETNRYELSNFYEFIPEKMFDIKKRGRRIPRSSERQLPIIGNERPKGRMDHLPGP